MTEWRIQLQGTSFDLQVMEHIFSSEDPGVFQENDNFYLKSKELNLLEDPRNVLDQAKRIIDLMNGAAYLHYRDSLPVSVNGIEKIDEDGKIYQILFAKATDVTLHARRTILGVNTLGDQSVERKDEQLIIRTLIMSRQYEKIANSVNFLRMGDWFNLYKAYEVVREDVTEKEIIHRGWMTETAINRFTQTAQSRDSIGDEARHAARKFRPHRNPMSIDEAKTIIGDLVQKWIDSIE